VQRIELSKIENDKAYSFSHPPAVHQNSKQFEYSTLEVAVNNPTEK
jgi:hypothetical protein